MASDPAKTTKNPPDYRQILLRELAKRRTRNTRYSLRAFGKHLGVSPGTLSDWVGGRRPMGRKAALKVCEALSLSPIDRRNFLEAVFSSKITDDAGDPYQYLETDKFHIISDWHHYAIINLTEVNGFTPTPEFISSRLGISKREATAALKRLEKVGLIKIVDGKLTVIHTYVSTANNIASAANRQHHSQILEKAQSSLQTDGFHERDMTSISMAIDPSLIPLAKEEIAKFRRRMCDLLNTGDKSRVYVFSLQLFPLDTRKATP